jgi:hypothetical protein
MITSNTGARFEIAIDGTPRAHYHDRAQAIEAARSLKAMHPGAGVTVRDVENGEMLVIIKRNDHAQLPRPQGHGDRGKRRRRKRRRTS